MHEVVFRGNIVPCNNTIMGKHNQLCNIVQSFQFMPVESNQNNCRILGRRPYEKQKWGK